MRAYRFLFVALLFVPLGAFAETYKIDTAHSRIAFSLHQFVSTVRGDFHRFSGTIEDTLLRLRYGLPRAVKSIVALLVAPGAPPR